VHRALEQEVSGTEVGWENPDSGSHGTVTPVRTYRSAAGIGVRHEAGAGLGLIVGTAQRDGKRGRHKGLQRLPRGMAEVIFSSGRGS
jgi:surface antigen